MYIIIFISLLYIYITLRQEPRLPVKCTTTIHRENPMSGRITLEHSVHVVYLEVGWGYYSATQDVVYIPSQLGPHTHTPTPTLHIATRTYIYNTIFHHSLPTLLYYVIPPVHK